MVIRIEANRKQGRGFQIHLMDGPLDKLFDTDPLDFYSALACAGELLELLNRELGTEHKLEDVLVITGDGLEERARGGHQRGPDAGGYPVKEVRAFSSRQSGHEKDRDRRGRAISAFRARRGSDAAFLLEGR